MSQERNEMPGLIKCPYCGGIMGVSSYGLFCKNKCGLYLGRAFSTPLTIEDTMNLLSGKEIIIQALSKSTGRSFYLAITWDGTYDTIKDAKYLHYSTRYPSSDEIKAYQTAKDSVPIIPPKPDTEVAVEKPYSFRFVDELVEVTDNYQIEGGMFDSMTVEQAITYCSQCDDIWFSHNFENHIRCVIYQAINNVYKGLCEPTIKDKVLALLEVFGNTLSDFIAEAIKISEATSFNATAEQAWIFVEHEMIFYLKNLCYRSQVGKLQQLQRNKELGEIAKHITIFLKEINPIKRKQKRSIL